MNVRARLAVFGLLLVVAALYVWRTLELRTSIVDFLPDDEHGQLLRIARELSQAPQSRIAVFTVSATDPEQQRAVARHLRDGLRASGAVHWVRSGLDGDDQQRFYETFFAARLGLHALDDGKGPVSTALIDDRIASLRERLASPLGPLTRELAPRDPLGTFESFLRGLASTQGELEMVDGQLTTRDGKWSVLFADVKAAPFDAEAQRSFARLVRGLEQRARSLRPDMKLEWTSVGRFAERAESSIRGDIERISLLSTLGILLLYVLVFRSLREPLLVMVPIVFGSVLALAACQLLFGFVHGLALAFGSSIVGVAEDFATHYFSHRLAEGPEQDNETLMKRLWPGMLLGGMTTVVGIASLFFSGFPGLAQMAVFGAVGVSGALFCTRYVLPPLTRRVQKVRPVSRGRSWSMRLLSQRPALVMVLVAAPMVLLLVGVSRLRFQDGVAALRTESPALDAENARVQARLGRAGAGRVVVALGADDEQALCVADKVHDALRALPVTQLQGQRSVSALLPSAQTQLARYARLHEDPTFVDRLRTSLRAHDFVAEAFEPFYQELQMGFRPVTVAAVSQSPLANLIAPFRAQFGEKVAYLTSISTSDPAAVGTTVSAIPGAFYIDQEALYSAAYGRFRERALSLSIWGALLVFLTILLRYRSFKVAALGMLPAVIGAGGALGALGVFGVPVSFINVIAVLLVLSMGEDYGIYALECEDEHEAATTLGSVLLAAATTVLSFGLLAWSDNPALSAIGLTVSVGLFFSVLASPVVLVLARRLR